MPLPKSAPGILIIHSHHNGKTQGELQDMGVMWARANGVCGAVRRGERERAAFNPCEKF